MKKWGVKMKKLLKSDLSLKHLNLRTSEKFLKVPLAVMSDVSLSSYALIVYLTLLLHFNKDHLEIYLSYRDIAGISRIPMSYIKPALEDLRKNGYLNYKYSSSIGKTIISLNDATKVEFFSSIDLYKAKLGEKQDEKVAVKRLMVNRGY